MKFICKPIYFVNTLRVIWALFLLYNEFFIYKFAAHQCAIRQRYEQAVTKGRFIFIGDPQITDDHSYNRPWIIMQLTKFYSSIYMKRNYKHIKSALQPTDIVMMGDLMDNGRDWNDETYKLEVERFHTIFPQDSSVDVHYMVGNHDIGFGSGIEEHWIKRFSQYFGPTSYIFQKYGYTFIVLDTISLGSDDPSIRQEAEEVLRQQSVLKDKNKILLTHVPLFRTDECGPYRQSKDKTIRQGRGYQYQNLLTEEMSDYLLKEIDPVLIFSGDDHDYCKIIHNGYNRSVEFTVPTFSMAQGLKYPGFVTLNMVKNETLAPTTAKQLTTHLCWLPNQVDIFINYAYLLIITLFILIIWSFVFNRKRFRRNYFVADNMSLPIYRTFYPPFMSSSSSVLQSNSTYDKPLFHGRTSEYQHQEKNSSLASASASHISTSFSPATSSFFYSVKVFVYTIKDIAWVSFIVYILCILIL
ncbi:Metallo-dependent phosphatase-like protein [Mycotypha africana]|uniref:Metallo-dependent phosphatase-like protein n=1 Tax=Mycotypha africana TaxID=64632 RepID=UPI002301B968|nr:Metallo-dependent phosphatase-like protein [Mycotypha africana]KAI8979531.1 Metallo-dependent phosphatase-like protein [Mycotypha africana]